MGPATAQFFSVFGTVASMIAAPAGIGSMIYLAVWKSKHPNGHKKKASAFTGALAAMHQLGGGGLHEPPDPAGLPAPPGADVGLLDAHAARLPQTRIPQFEPRLMGALEAQGMPMRALGHDKVPVFEEMEVDVPLVVFVDVDGGATFLELEHTARPGAGRDADDASALEGAGEAEEPHAALSLEDLAGALPEHVKAWNVTVEHFAGAEGMEWEKGSFAGMNVTDVLGLMEHVGVEHWVVHERDLPTIFNGPIRRLNPDECLYRYIDNKPKCPEL